MNRRARFSELWKWISSYSEVFDCRPTAYAQDRFPPFPLLTANAFDVKCRKRSARYTVVRIAECQGKGRGGDRGMRAGEKGRKEILEFELENLWKCIFPRCECWLTRIFTRFLTITNILPAFCKIVQLTLDYARPTNGQIFCLLFHYKYFTIYISKWILYFSIFLLPRRYLYNLMNLFIDLERRYKVSCNFSIISKLEYFNVSRNEKVENFCCYVSPKKFSV